MKKSEFFPGPEGNKGGGKVRDALQCSFCVLKENLFWTSLFFNFWINIGFVIPKKGIQEGWKI